MDDDVREDGCWPSQAPQSHEFQFIGDSFSKKNETPILRSVVD